MNGLPACLLYSRDEGIERRFKALLQSVCAVCSVNDPAALQRMASQMGPGLLLIDLCAPEALRQIEELRRACPQAQVVALGEWQSDPARRAMELGVFGISPAKPARMEFQTLVRRALDFVALIEERNLLRERQSATPAPAGPARQPQGRPLGVFLRHFARAQRHFDCPDTLLVSMIEAAADATAVTRAGLFLRDAAGRGCRLRAEMNALPETAALVFEDDDPFLRWMEIHAHIVSRPALEHVREPEEHRLLRRALDLMGAEALVPLHGRGRFLGWLFFGRRATGMPFDEDDLQELMTLAEYLSRAIENALLHGEVARQKELADALFHALPLGVLAVSREGLVRAANHTIREWLDPAPAEGEPVERLGGPLVGLVRAVLAREAPARELVEWTPPGGKALSAEAQRLGGEGPLGALVLVRDLTQLRALQARQEEIERAAFWTELAASMSHEIRNPLVAIKTFAQLLPERFDDPEFRKEFSGMVSAEVDRLNGMVDQINAFAHPPRPAVGEVQPQRLAEHAVERGSALFGRKHAGVEIDLAPGCSPFQGDEQALAEALGHLLCNALEAVEKRKGARVLLSGRPADGGKMIAFQVNDNGPGIPEDLREKIYSPFCTSKARGLGLGLAIARRTAMDHDGALSVESDAAGVRATLRLPVGGGGREHE